MTFRKVSYLLAMSVAALGLQLRADETQAMVGEIRGVARQAGGQTLSTVRVTVRSVTERTEQTVISDGDGAFLIAGLKPGQYELTAKADGFATESPITVAVTAQSTAS